MKRRWKTEKLIALVFSFLAYFIFTYTYTQPSPLALPGAPPAFYSTQAGNNLQDTLIASLKDAKKSIVLIIYTLKDPKIIEILNEKARAGLDVKVIYDSIASQGVNKKLTSEIKIFPRGMFSLMHLKLLIIDGQHSFLGSANMTRDALQQHANLLVHLDNTRFAQVLLQKAEQLISNHYEEPIPPALFQMDQQLIELRFLPDDSHAIARLQELIRSAKKSIKVAMYTFTRQDLAQALVRAQHRGVKVEVIIDESSGNGASAKIVELLAKEGIKAHLTREHGLMHNKFMLIDDEILVHGSANWTKAAFKQNDDYIMVLINLTPPQKQVMQLLWNAINIK